MLNTSKILHHKLLTFQKIKLQNNLRRLLSLNNTNNLKENENSNKDSYYFGFQQVTSSEKQEKVQSVFSSVAEKYDLMNDVMSAGIHRLWKDYFIHTLSPTVGMNLLDVAGGTGDIAFRFLKAASDSSDSNPSDLIESPRKSQVTVLDFNDKMLSVCKAKAIDAGVEDCLTCIQGNAEILPFPDNSFDVYTIAFGIRNVVHIDKALSEAHRVLCPGGRFLCLEFSEFRNPALHSIYEWYSREILPVMGEVIAGDYKSYQYLVESIRKFPNQEQFSCMIKESGLNYVTFENLSSGIAAIHSAYKL